jgi:hypothetical protein
MSDAAPRSFQGYSDPLELVDRTDIAYEERLAILQEWQAELARVDAPEEERQALQGAIHALEMGAEVQNDEPEGAPRAHGYGKPTK